MLVGVKLAAWRQWHAPCVSVFHGSRAVLATIRDAIVALVAAAKTDAAPGV